MDESLDGECLSYTKDELQNVRSVIQEDDLETLPLTTESNDFNDQDYSAITQLELMRLDNNEHPMKPERRTFLNEYNIEEADENIIKESETVEQESYAPSEIESAYTVESLGIINGTDHWSDNSKVSQESLEKFGSNGNFMSSDDLDKFNLSFINNNISSSNEDEFTPEKSPTTLNDKLSRSAAENEQITASLLIDDRCSSLTKSNDDSKLLDASFNETELITNVTAINDKEDSIPKMSSSPVKTSRPKIEDTEMPTKG
ncbi:unnamed protein product [Thelazia callipaeda]|uniref:Clathrin light chain n=1 Tax=Thelazia callipaeda TaxID=103827 RepID=A0A0N5CXI9_THECL|nr:unnamed protein product [Thelazia callipaeda]